MTRSEALTKVEGMLTALGLEDPYGPLEGIHALSALYDFRPDHLARLEAKFFLGEMAPEAYVMEMGALMEAFKAHLFVVRIDRRLGRMLEGA